MFDVFITRDKTSMRYQTHYQLKQMWLDPFGNCQAIGGNELQIQVENPDINLYVAYGWHSLFYHSSAQMSHYASVANTASTYSVSSGSGSSGGGFSGGGGGGSIGAF
ncbi:Uncharacterised protein [Streptococcus pneumoniae]|nr:Uncharacterised protein [Streptococcus pneumoniae]